MTSKIQPTSSTEKRKKPSNNWASLKAKIVDDAPRTNHTNQETSGKNTKRKRPLGDELTSTTASASTSQKNKKKKRTDINDTLAKM